MTKTDIAMKSTIMDWNGSKLDTKIRYACQWKFIFILGPLQLKMKSEKITKGSLVWWKLCAHKMNMPWLVPFAPQIEAVENHVWPAESPKGHSLTGRGSWHLSTQLGRRFGARTHYSGLLWLWRKTAELAFSSRLPFIDSLGFRGTLAATGFLSQQRKIVW